MHAMTAWGHGMINNAWGRRMGSYGVNKGPSQLPVRPLDLHHAVYVHTNRTIPPMYMNPTQLQVLLGFIEGAVQQAQQGGGKKGAAGDDDGDDGGDDDGDEKGDGGGPKGGACSIFRLIKWAKWQKEVGKRR